MDKRTIGQILVSMGKISDADVARALEYQRDHGGYFGQALLACELVTEAELEFCLASQFDLPYVFPEADAVDLEAASLVSAEWALSHLALPILMTDRSVTVVVESPLRGIAVDELRARTDREVELALASGSTIRELIREVYARAAAAEGEGGAAPVELTEFLDEVLSLESARFGVSVRGPRALAWWDDRGTVRRRPLAGDWLGDLERLVTPGPGLRTAGKLRTSWDAELMRAGMVLPVTARFLADESGSEYLFEARPAPASPEDRFPAPPAGVVSEVRLLARSGQARFIVTTDPPALGREILPHLPTLLLDPAWRSIYLAAGRQPAAGEAFSITLPAEPEAWGRELESLRAFRFDVVTVDLSGEAADWTQQALDVAGVAFLRWPAERGAGPAYEAGIRWRLHVARDEVGESSWRLESLTS